MSNFAVQRLDDVGSRSDTRLDFMQPCPGRCAGPQSKGPSSISDSGSGSVSGSHSVSRASRRGSSTNGCADHLPTAASNTDQTLNIAQTADSKPPIIALTKPYRISSICSPQPDPVTSLLKIAQTADSNPPIIALTKPSRISSILKLFCLTSPQPDPATSLLKSFCLTFFRLESTPFPRFPLGKGGSPLANS